MEFVNKFDVPLPLALWLTIDEYEPSKYSNEISATGLLKSPRYIMAHLRANNPELFPEHLRPVPVEPNAITYPDIQERIASRVGTAIHSSVEYAWLNYAEQGLKALGYPEEQIKKVRINPVEPEEDTIPIYLENRLYRTIEIGDMKFTISGQYDLIVNGNLHDIKTTSTYSYENGVNDSKYTKQGSIYRWLNPELITGSDLTINFLFMDYKQYLDQRNGNYPPAKAYFKKYPLLSLFETESFIRNKLKVIVEHWDSPLEMIPCCSIEDLFSNKPVFKYYKNGVNGATRSTKNFDTFNEAIQYRAKNGFKGDIVEDRGRPFMCPCCNPAEVEMLTQGIHKQTKLEVV